MFSLLVLWCTLLFSVSLGNREVYRQPEQVHLSYGADPTQMIVTWTTMTPTVASVVEYGEIDLSLTAKGEQKVFIDGGSEKRMIFIHTVTLTGLTPQHKYIYHVGSTSGWSGIFSFSTMPLGSDWSPRFAIFGDMGNENGQSVGRLQEDTQSGKFDAIIHVGDFAYDMDTDNARVGDVFMNQAQSYAAYVPYMTCPGNHEMAYNFSNYKNRMNMPGDSDSNMFYSIDIGPVHFVSFNSEYYYFVQYGWDQIIQQFKWLEQDLIKANKPENRALRPWIISMCHRPMYCSNSNDDEHCPNLYENLIRVGIPIDRAYGVEDLLYKYGVDIHFQAHEHSYERMWPVYNLTVCNGSMQEPYRNPRAPVQIVTGSAGNREGEDPFYVYPFPWSAYRSDDYGYTMMTVHNATHLSMEQISDDKDGEIIDSIVVIKDKHGPGLYDCHQSSGRPKPELENIVHSRPNMKPAVNQRSFQKL